MGLDAWLCEAANGGGEILPVKFSEGDDGGSWLWLGVFCTPLRMVFDG